MKIGDTIEIRAPKAAMQYSTSYAKHIGMIADDTGVTPIYQLIRVICDDKDDSAWIDLLYADNTEDILLRDELDGFAKMFPDTFRVQYELSKLAECWSGHRGSMDF
jgi:cytochrome-b5 reductase